MKAFSSREVIKILENDGWQYKNSTGSHKHYIHPWKKGKVTIPHPRKNLPRNTVFSILKQAGIDIKD